MKFSSLISYFLAFILVIIAPTTAHSQNANQVDTWFKAGLEDKEPEKKLSFDPQAPTFGNVPRRLRDAHDAHDAHAALAKEQNRVALTDYYYAEAVYAINAKRLKRTRQTLAKIQPIDAICKDTATVFRQMGSQNQPNEKKSKVAVLAEQPGQRKPLQIAYVNSLYDLAEYAMKQKDWNQTLQVLEMLRTQVPENETINMLIENVQKNSKTIENMEPKSIVRKAFSTLFSVKNAIMTAILMPLLWLIMTSSAHAKLLYFLNNYIAAAHCYERIIRKHPRRISAYKNLANIYLLLGRTDGRAVSLFKIILSLNIVKDLHPRINYALSQKRLQPLALRRIIASCRLLDMK